MAIELVNGHFTRLSRIMDAYLMNLKLNKNDQYTDGKWRMYGDFSVNNSTFGVSGSAVMIDSNARELSENMRLNPLCNFKEKTFDKDSLTGYCVNKKVADPSDSKVGRVYLNSEEIADADINANMKTVIFDASKAVGNFKTLYNSINCIDNVLSGVCFYQQYALNTDDSGTPLTTYGFPAGITGLTGEFEIILSNDKLHCQAIKNIKTGKLTYIEETDPRYNIPCPSNFHAVAIGTKVYFNGFYNSDSACIMELDTETWQIRKNTNNNYYYLFTDGTNLFNCSYRTSRSNSNYVQINIETFGTTGSYIEYHDNIPKCLIYDTSYPSMYTYVLSIDSGTKYVVYSTQTKCAVVCTNLSDIKGSMIDEYTQVQLPSASSFSLTSDGLYTFMRTNLESFSFASNEALSVCKNNNGHILSCAEWSEIYTNNGKKQVSVTICE